MSARFAASRFRSFSRASSKCGRNHFFFFLLIFLLLRFFVSLFVCEFYCFENMDVSLRLVQLIFSLLYMIVYGLWRYFLPRKGPSKIPPIRNRLLTLSVVEVLELYQKRKVWRKKNLTNLNLFKITCALEKIINYKFLIKKKLNFPNKFWKVVIFTIIFDILF